MRHFRTVRQMAAPPPAKGVSIKQYRAQLQQANSTPMWLLFGTACAPTINIFFGGVKLTLARIGILCLLIPALSNLLSGRRRAVASDWFACALAVWMVGATTVADGFNSSVFAEALEFVGAYLVARAYVFGPVCLAIFVRVLEIVVITLVALALLDTLSGRNITLEITAMILPGVGASNAYRLNLVRASSTFDGSTQFGTFCAASAAVLFYSSRTVLKRFIYGGASVLGCALSITSAAFMGLGIVMSTYAYDQLLHSYSQRWKLYVVACAALICSLFLISNDPVGSIIGHLTFDPSDGWFRLNTWMHATHNISLSPWVGYGFQQYGDPDDYFDQASVDCVYLVVALRFGLPAVAFLILTNLGSFVRFGPKPSAGPYMDKMATGLTLAICTWMFIGLTVHYWNGPWILWGLFIGVRASLKEYGSAKATTRRVIVQRPTRFRENVTLPPIVIQRGLEFGVRWAHPKILIGSN